MNDKPPVKKEDKTSLPKNWDELRDSIFAALIEGHIDLTIDEYTPTELRKLLILLHR